MHPPILKSIAVIFVGIVFGISCDTPTDSSGKNFSPAPEDLQCKNGMVDDIYPCNKIDLMAHVSVSELLAEPLEDGSAVNDIWGWTDPESNKEYVLVGLNDGVTFVDISSPKEPFVVGKLNEPESVSDQSKTDNNSLHHEGKSSWRDFKVYANHLFVVSDDQPHGMQVFDLTTLRDVENPPQIFTEDYHYTAFENAHNIAINEETGFAYVTGSNTYGGGLHIVDVTDPLTPQFAGFHNDSSVGIENTGYVHDTQCVNYHGPDTDYQDEEICLNSSETHLLIANVSDKENTQTIAKATHGGNQYAHQGWLTEDQRYFLMDDEYDELHRNGKTHTYIWDLQDLDNPQMIGTYVGETRAIDHNQFVKENYVYQSNYTAGLRILSLGGIAEGRLKEVAYFDTFPDNNAAQFEGSWSNYPYFESGIIAAGDISNGLFILWPRFQ